MCHNGYLQRGNVCCRITGFPWQTFRLYSEVELDILSQIFLPILLLVLTLVSGFRLSHAGRPYNGIFFNSHKLLAFGAVVISVMRIYRMPGVAPQALSRDCSSLQPYVRWHYLPAGH